MKNYPLLGTRVSAPKLELRGATDDLLDQLAPLVRDGKTHAHPPPYDDPMSFYESDPDLRVGKWLRAIWRGRGRVDADDWRLNFVVIVDSHPVGEQTLTGVNFSTFGTVTTFSWLSVDQRGRGVGREMREAVLHLAFDGLGAREASSDAFVDNVGSNAISRDLGYQPNGSDGATRQGEPAVLNRWRLTRETWQRPGATSNSTTGMRTRRCSPWPDASHSLQTRESAHLRRAWASRKRNHLRHTTRWHFQKSRAQMSEPA